MICLVNAILQVSLRFLINIEISFTLIDLSTLSNSYLSLRSNNVADCVKCNFGLLSQRSGLRI